jgi:hypothetical protein
VPRGGVTPKLSESPCLVGSFESGSMDALSL